MKQINISKELVESFGYEFNEGEQVNPGFLKTTGDIAAAGTAGWGAGKIASKALGRVIPGVTAGINALDAKRRWDTGDTVGAAISGISGAVSLIPGLGVPVSLALDAVNIGRDVGSMATDYFNKKPNPSPLTPDDERAAKLKALQKIIGTEPDGKYGPKTRDALIVWQKQHGLQPDGMPGPKTFKAAGLTENTMKQKKTIAEDIASLRNKLDIIENHSQVDEGVFSDMFGGAVNAAKSAFKPGAKAAASAAADAGEAGIKAGTTAADTTAAGIKSANTVVDKGFSDAVKRMGVVEKDGKIWGRDPQNVGKWTELEKVGDDFVRPNQAAGFNNATWYANGPMAKELEKKLAGVNPAKVEQETAKALENTAVNEVDKAAIKQKGLIAWIKENPKKAALYGFLAGLGIGALSNIDNPTPLPVPPVPPVPPNPNRKGDPYVMKQQQLLNAFTGSNLVIDGIWGPATQAASDLAQKITANQNADMQAGLSNIDDVKAKYKKQQANSATSQLGQSIGKSLDQDFMKPDSVKSIEKQTFESLSMAESIAQLRDVLSAIENK